MHGCGVADQLCAESHSPFGRLFQLREPVAQGDMHIISRQAITQATHGLFTHILWMVNVDSAPFVCEMTRSGNEKWTREPRWTNTSATWRACAFQKTLDDGRLGLEERLLLLYSFSKDSWEPDTTCFLPSVK